MNHLNFIIRCFIRITITDNNIITIPNATPILVIISETGSLIVGESSDLSPPLLSRIIPPSANIFNASLSSLLLSLLLLSLIL